MGTVLLATSLLTALAVALHPARDRIDRWGFSLVTPARHSALLVHVASLGSVPALVLGSIVAALVALGSDRRRAAICLGAPLLAAVIAEWIMKPLVGRYYLGALTFPSGTVTTVAALAVVCPLAIPSRLPVLRRSVAALGGVAVVAAAVAVVGLRWHYPTDAFGGALLGAGVVLSVDGLVHLRSDRSAAGRH